MDALQTEGKRFVKEPKLTDINRERYTGKRFREVLRHYGISLKRFAETAGMTPNYVYHVLGDYPGFEISESFIETALNCPIIQHLALDRSIFEAKGKADRVARE